MKAAEFYEPPLGFFGVAWRLFVSPWLPMFLLAGVVLSRPDLPLNVVSGLIMTLPVTAVIGAVLGLIAVIGGYPLYAWYRRRGWSQWWVYALGGAFVPTVICALPASLGVFDPSWFGYLSFLVFLGPMGALSGLVFWALLRWRDRTVTANEPPVYDR